MEGGVGVGVDYGEFVWVFGWVGVKQNDVECRREWCGYLDVREVGGWEGGVRSAMCTLWVDLVV